MNNKLRQRIAYLLAHPQEIVLGTLLRLTAEDLYSDYVEQDARILSEAEAYAASLVTSAGVLANGEIFVGNPLNIATAVPMSGQATIINTGAVTLSNAAVIAKILTGYVSGAGTISASDSLLSAIQKLNGNTAALITGVSSVFGRTGTVIAISGDYNTSLVTEVTNLYFTNARAIASLLTSYTSGAGTISSSDSILSAIQKLNGNIGALVTGVSSVNSLTGAVALTGTANRITISAANVFDIGTSVITLTGSQALSNKTGLISQWANDSGYLSSLTGALLIANNLSDLANAGTARTNLGATTVGSNLFTLTNPSAITFLRLNADNSVSALSASAFRTAIGAGAGSVLTISIASANGFAGSSDGNSSAPTLTISTSITGLLKGNGTAISAASAGSDYVSPNVAITGGTNTKITYDTKGLVTAGSQAAAADLSNGVSGSGAIILAASPALTGNPTAPTQSPADNSTRIATTSYVDTADSGKLSTTLTSAHIYVGNGSNVATDVALTGDISISNAGLSAIGNLKVVNAMIAANTIDLAAKVTGILGLSHGGVNADLSATGGTSQVLKQTSVGGAVTVAQLAASDLSNGTSGSGAISLVTSPALLGSPTAPTQSASDNSTKIATTSYIDSINPDVNILIYKALGSTVKATVMGQGIDKIGTTGTTLSNQEVDFLAMPIEAPCIISGVKWWQITQGSYTPNNFNGWALFTISAGTLTQVAITANTGTCWSAPASNSVGSLAFTSTYAAVRGMYYAAPLYCRSAQVTAPVIGSFNPQVAINSTTWLFDFTNSNKLFAFKAAQTTMPSTQDMSGLTGGAGTWEWAALY